MQNNPGICTSSLTQQSTGWQFMFQIFITEKSAEKFADITQNMKSMVDPNSGESYLDSRIYLYLDGNEITNLGISSDLAGKALTQPVITGGSAIKEDALNEKLKLQSILKSGALPVGVKIIRADDISPSLGKEFTNSALKTVIIAMLAVAIVIFLRYRKIKILVPMMIWSAAELTLTLGVASYIHWTLDMASIAGLIAAIGTGTNDQIMIIDEIMLGEKEKIYTLKQKVKKSFGIIFSAAATIIAAMLPLFFVGIGVMKGFAITTTIGILIGVLITRTAFATVMEHVLDRSLDKPKPIENKVIESPK
jgi:preprotein translocase subunit SecD